MSESERRPRVLFISGDPVGREMAGLGIRYYELARAVSENVDVTLAHGGSAVDAQGLPPGREDLRLIAFRVHDPGPLRSAIVQADAVVTHPQWPLVTSWLRDSRARLIYDLYDPETLETLELFAGRPKWERRLMVQLTIDRLHDALRTGHHFMCASEKQRDLWVGAMLALRLIDPRRYDTDPSFRGVIDTVPYGVPPQPDHAPRAQGPRERFPALGVDAEVILWNGGVWKWLDAPTAIRAVGELARRRPRARLVFMAAGHNHPASERATGEALEVARDLGLLDRIVFFNDGWVPYAERGAWLGQAACAVSAQPDHLETRFAFRTRLLDCFWARVPIVCTAGDDLADRVVRDGLGEDAPPGDPRALAGAMERVLQRGRAAYAPALERAAEAHSWGRVAAPLRRWLAENERPQRLGATTGAVRRTPAHRLRAAAYRAGGRAALARRRRG